VAARHGENKAIIALVHEMLTIAYYVITTREEYRGMNNELYRKSSRG